MALLAPEMRKKTEIYYNGQQAIVNRETGEASDDRIAIARVKHVDSENFVKMYTAQLSIFFELTNSAQRMCDYICHLVGQPSGMNTDLISIFPTNFKEFCEARFGKGGNRNDFNQGQRELAEKGLIAKGPNPYQWFINPTVIFNGDRARFITEFQKRKKNDAIQGGDDQAQLFDASEEAV